MVEERQAKDWLRAQRIIDWVYEKGDLPFWKVGIRENISVDKVYKLAMVVQNMTEGQIKYKKQVFYYDGIREPKKEAEKVGSPE